MRFLLRNHYEISRHLRDPLRRNQVSKEEDATPSKEWNTKADYSLNDHNALKTQIVFTVFLLSGS